MMFMLKFLTRAGELFVSKHENASRMTRLMYPSNQRYIFPRTTDLNHVHLQKKKSTLELPKVCLKIILLFPFGAIC